MVEHRHNERLKMNLTRSFAVILSAALLTGCAMNGRPISDYCMLTKPIYIKAEDQFSEATAKKILVHNRTWRRFCK